MCATLAPRDLLEPADHTGSARLRILAALILLVVLAGFCVLQTLSAPAVPPAPTSYTACLSADGNLYGLAEGLSPATLCGPGDTTVQATLTRDTARDGRR